MTVSLYGGRGLQQTHHHSLIGLGVFSSWAQRTPKEAENGPGALELHSPQALAMPSHGTPQGLVCSGPQPTGLVGLTAPRAILLLIGTLDFGRAVSRGFCQAIVPHM
ncbi:hypothetical protein NDU88_000727 [Pleurodeles waltl]|uniref:Uncharacterized protein n=1 Tax=Pleurodeles waltl TaxID=8319 RepID=A0AAV7LJC7_PLEWA|nr:hypothetical protein NDU88_000727 [Pleurodeles waltl]